MTPAGIQSCSVLKRRRLIFGLAVFATLVALAYNLLIALGLDQGRWTIAESAIFGLSLFALPWYALGLWNALIGLWLSIRGKKGLYEAAPYLRGAEASEPLRLRVAVIMTIRNEVPSRAYARLAAVRDSLEVLGQADNFDYFMLSDTTVERIAAMEEALGDAWQKNRASRSKFFYRRREVNTDFKAGNVWEFVDRWGANYDLMLPLDADSIMSGDTIVRLVKTMQAYPKLGILQSLTAGTPASSIFARLFQFGMRHGMRSYTLGAAWWTGDCGPYWGHNAVIRIKAFRNNCALPHLSGKPPLGGPILSHDQIEAALMRRGGYEVRVLPVEAGSYEDSPPTLLEFAQRDVRWCQGNLQYCRLLTWHRLKFISRMQITLAIIMYLGSVATTLCAGLVLAVAAAGGFENANKGAALVFFSAIAAASLAPKLAGLFMVLAREGGGSARYGGLGWLLTGFAVEIVFTWTLSVIVALRSTAHMTRWLFGLNILWGAQNRDAHELGWRMASWALWPETLTATAIFLTLAWFAPAALIWALPVIVPLGLSIPFAVWTASKRGGRLLSEWRLCGIPEEFEQAEILQRLAVENKRMCEWLNLSTRPPEPVMRDEGLANLP